MLSGPTVGSAGASPSRRPIPEITQVHLADETDSTDSPDPYFVRRIECGSRIGFLAQKLREPRSFDYLTKKDKYYSRLQMPQFPFDERQREEVMTFILGLVAQPPPKQFVHRPSETDLAVAQGEQLMEQYNCAGCHVLTPQRWELAFGSGMIPEQPDKPTFPFVRPSASEEEIEASKVNGSDGLLHATVAGMPTVFDVDGLPFVLNEDEEPLEEDEEYETDTLYYLFDLWEPAVIDGQPFRPGVVPLMLTADMIRQQHPAEGGELGRLLFSRALTHVRQTDPVAKGSEAWAWLPPPLMGQGRKVQSPWLYEYLLNPTTIRPAAIMKMPRFPLSPPEAERLAQYFAQIDGADYPYSIVPQQDEAYVQAAREKYDERLAELTAENGETLQGDHFDDAIRIVLGQDYCVKCHLIGDFSPGGSRFVIAPNLANVNRRLRPEYLRQWIADPTVAQPYTTMPVLIPYQEGADHEGGVPQDLYYGTSTEQLGAVVDLLLNFDRYSAEKNPSIEAAKRKLAGESEPPES